MPDTYTVSTTPNYSELLTKLVSRELLANLRGGLTYAPPGALRMAVYQQGGEDIFVYGQVPDLSATIPPELDELLPPDVELIESVTAEFSTTERARSVGFSSKLLRQQPFSAAQVISERVARSASELVNLTLKSEWESVHSGEPTMGVGTTEVTTDLLINARSYLEANDVPPLAGGDYGVLCSPYFVASIKREVGEKAWNAAALEGDGGRADLQAGILGRWQGFIFMGSSVSVPATGTTETAIVIGADSIAVADLGSLATYLVLPTASISDPVAQRGIASFRIRLGAQCIAKFQRQGATVPVYGHIKLLAKLVKPTVTLAS